MYTFISDLVRQAGAVLLRYFRSTDLQAEAKGVGDLVTAADRAAEIVLVEAVRARFPDHDVFAEESGRSGTAARLCWLIDPLDGTVNFAHGLPTWGVSVALAYDGQVRFGAFLDPMHDELVYAERGQGVLCNGRPARASGVVDPSQALIDSTDSHGPRSALTYCTLQRLWDRAMDVHTSGCVVRALADVAVGRKDAVIGLGGGPWDYAAAGLLVQEAGGHATTFDGLPLSTTAATMLAAATADLHDALRALVHE